MRAGVIGMNYKLCDLELRELFAKKAEALSKESFSSLGLPIVLLSTCNRTEIYFSAEDLAEGHTQLLSQLKKEMGEIPDHCFYSYFGDKCFAHLAKVTSGADSVIFGEAEIQRQVKEAYEKGSSSQELAADLHFMFQKSLKVGKEIRTAFSLPKTQVSIESTCMDLLRFFFQESKQLSILFVGFSEINRKIIPFLQQKGFLDLYLVTRNRLAAQQESWLKPDRILGWDSLDSWPSYDVVVSGSVSSEYLITAGPLAHRPVSSRLVIDLSLPRNVDPQVQKHPSITLFNIEEINLFISQKEQSAFEKKQQIVQLIEEKVGLQSKLYLEKQHKVFVCA